jgi:uncharacterized protein
MKVVLMADSHDNMNALKKAVHYCNLHQVGAVLHAGDLVAPFVNRVLKDLLAPLTIVFGNNDGEKNGLLQVFKNKIFEPPHETSIDGRRVLMFHDPAMIKTVQDADSYDLILHGHIHTVTVQKEKKLLVNPGELCGWLSGTSTLALWDTEANTAEIVVI